MIRVRQADGSQVVGSAAPDLSQDSASFVLGLTSPGGGRQPHGEVVKVADSYTGQYLARLLPRSAAAKKRA